MYTGVAEIDINILLPYNEERPDNRRLHSKKKETLMLWKDKKCDIGLKTFYKFSKRRKKKIEAGLFQAEEMAESLFSFQKKV